MEHKDRNKVFMSIYDRGELTKMGKYLSMTYKGNFPPDEIESTLYEISLKVIEKFEGDEEACIKYLWKMCRLCHRRGSEILTSLLRKKGYHMFSLKGEAKQVEIPHDDLTTLGLTTNIPVFWIRLRNIPEYAILVEKFLFAKDNIDIAKETGTPRHIIDKQVKTALAKLKKEIENGTIDLGGDNAWIDRLHRAD
jgi:hypothetical protein